MARTSTLALIAGASGALALSGCATDGYGRYPGGYYGDRYYDRDDNPPGPTGGRGTDWENPPGPRGGPGASPDRPRRW
jgi:hypothetical protein